MTIASTASAVPGLNLGAGQFGVPGPVPDPTAALGAISSQEWSTYMQHFVPMENQLIQYAMNPNQAATNMATAEGLQQQESKQASGIATRQLQQQDTQLTQQQQEAAGKQRGINAASAIVNTANQAKDVTVANQMSILGAPMSGVTGAV